MGLVDELKQKYNEERTKWVESHVKKKYAQALANNRLFIATWKESRCINIEEMVIYAYEHHYYIMVPSVQQKKMAEQIIRNHVKTHGACEPYHMVLDGHENEADLLRLNHIFTASKYDDYHFLRGRQSDSGDIYLPVFVINCSADSVRGLQKNAIINVVGGVAIDLDKLDKTN